MYVCMYVCMHVCMYVCMYYVCIQNPYKQYVSLDNLEGVGGKDREQVCMCVCVCVCVYVCMQPYVYRTL